MIVCALRMLGKLMRGDGCRDFEIETRFGSHLSELGGKIAVIGELCCRGTSVGDGEIELFTLPTKSDRDRDCLRWESEDDMGEGGEGDE